MKRLFSTIARACKKCSTNTLCRNTATASTFVVGFWLATAAAYWVVVELNPDHHQAVGTFGDSFGAVNALFSGLAFVGVIVAILIQSNELKLQRRELRLSRTQLRLTREELNGQKAQMVEQSKIMSRQPFENTFFKMLDSFDNIREYIAAMTRGYDRREVRGELE
ncbi:MAG: hypothetical protein Aurels2KO_28070 [Aureliella sp.]